MDRDAFLRMEAAVRGLRAALEAAERAHRNVDVDLLVRAAAAVHIPESTIRAVEAATREIRKHLESGERCQIEIIPFGDT